MIEHARSLDMDLYLVAIFSTAWSVDAVSSFFRSVDLYNVMIAWTPSFTSSVETRNGDAATWFGSSSAATSRCAVSSGFSVPVTLADLIGTFV